MMKFIPNIWGHTSIKPENCTAMIDLVCPRIYLIPMGYYPSTVTVLAPMYLRRVFFSAQHGTKHCGLRILSYLVILVKYCSPYPSFILSSLTRTPLLVDVNYVCMHSCMPHMYTRIYLHTHVHTCIISVINFAIGYQ